MRRFRRYPVLTLRAPVREVDADSLCTTSPLRGRALGAAIHPAGPVILAVKSAGGVCHAPSGSADDLALRVAALQPGRTRRRVAVEIAAAGAPRATAEVVWMALDRATRRPVALPNGWPRRPVTASDKPGARPAR